MVPPLELAGWWCIASAGAVLALSLEDAFPEFRSWLAQTDPDTTCPQLTAENVDDLLWKQQPVGAVGAIVLVGSNPEVLETCNEMRKSHAFIGMANIAFVSDDNAALELGLPEKVMSHEDSLEASADGVNGVVIPYSPDVDKRRENSRWLRGGRALARALRETVPTVERDTIDMQSFQLFVTSSFQANQLPVAYFTDRAAPPATIDALFGDLEGVDGVATKVFVNTSAQESSFYEMKVLPVLLIFTPGNVDEATGKMQLQKIEFPLFEKLKYITGLLWVMQSVDQYGIKNVNDDDSDLEIETPQPRYGDPTLYPLTQENQDEIMNSKATILVLGLLDSADEAFEDHRMVLEALGKNPVLENRSLRYTFVDSACYSEVGAAFGVSQYPQVIAINNVRNSYTIHPAAFEEQRLVSWLSKLLKGGLGMRAMSDTESFRVDNRDCSEIRTQKIEAARQAMESEDGMDDIMAEIAAEKRAQEEQAKMEEIEAAKQAKASTGKKKSKKGKGKKKKKKVTTKDEL